MRGDVDVKADGAQRREIGDGRFRARQDHEVGVARQRRSRPQPDQIDRRLGLQRVEVVEIGDVGQDRHGDTHPRLRLDGPILFQCERILGGQQPCLREKRHEPERRPAGRLCDAGHALRKQSGIAAKFVDDEAADACSVRLSFQQKRIHVLSGLDPTGYNYHVLEVARLSGPLNLDALEAIDFLHFIDHVFLKFLRTADIEDVVRRHGALGELLAFFYEVALEDDDVLVQRHEMLFVIPGIRVGNDDLALAASLRQPSTLPSGLDRPPWSRLMAAPQRRAPLRVSHRRPPPPRRAGRGNGKSA